MGKIAASAIESAASIANTTATNAYNLQMTRETNQANREITESTNQWNYDLAKSQNDWNREQWINENRYNAPAEQVKRLKEAGLSDAAAAQNIEGAGNASSLESADLANQQVGNPMQAGHIDSFGIPSIIGIMRDALALEREGSDTDMKKQDAEVHDQFLLTDLDARRQQIELSKQTYLNIEKSFPYSLRLLRGQAKNESKKGQLFDAEIAVNRANKELVDMNVKRARQDFGFLEKMNQKTLEKVSAEIKNVYKQGDVLDEQKQNIAAQTQNVEEQTKTQKEVTRSKRVEAILNENGFPESQAERVAVMLDNGVIKPENVYNVLNGTRQYVREGNQWFGSDPFTRDFLYYYWDAGKRRAAGLGTGSMGFINEVLNSFQNRPFK